MNIKIEEKSVLSRADLGGVREHWPDTVIVCLFHESCLKKESETKTRLKPGVSSGAQAG